MNWSLILVLKLRIFNNVANLIDDVLSIEFDIIDSRNNLLTKKSINYSAVTKQINMLRNELIIPLNSFANTPLVTNIKASVTN